MTTKEKLTALRGHMKAAGIDAYLLPSSDPHMSEYLPGHWKGRAYLSGFDGSAGTLVVTAKDSALWTDGRYFIQAERQLTGSEIQLMRIGVTGVPSVEQFLLDSLPENGVLGVEFSTVATSTVRSLLERASDKNLRVLDMALPADIWPDRPPVPASKIWAVAPERTGKSAKEKIDALRSKLANAGCDAMMVSRLDDLAWLLNLRASDIEHTPVFLGYLWVTPDTSTLFTDLGRLPQDIRDELRGQGVDAADYAMAVEALQSENEERKCLMEAEGSNYALYMAAEANSNIEVKLGEDPIQLMKSVKNEVEIACTIEAHAKDGVAMLRFQMDLERALAEGKSLTERDVAEMIRKRRSEQEGFLDESFSTIAAYGANAAMMHYAPKEGSAATLERKGFLLLDSGGQYEDGTTDITRTYALGDPTPEERDYYTLVLSSHIDMTMAVFMEGSSGANIDILAREAFWKRGLDYRCGTGHGVGYIGGVHEGPHSLRGTNRVPFQAGMVITDEPGIYEEGKIGIRIENELICREAMTTEYGRFLHFQVITFCPIDTRAVDPNTLGSERLDWLNRYHKLVYDTLEGRLTQSEKAWLADKCAPLKG